MAVTEKKDFRQQFAALKNLPPLFKLIWKTNKYLAAANIGLRLIASVFPSALLFVGKEIIDSVVQLVNHKMNDPARLWRLVALEFALGLISQALGRSVSLVDTLLGDLFSNQTSIEIIRHAATLDLYQFEDPVFYDKLERARRQTTGRTVLMSQVLDQCQDIITVFILGAGLAWFNPWLILILIVSVIPSFLGESYFNQQVYSLTLGFTPQRRELDYLRYIGASDETAKEVKIFGIADFLANRFQDISHKYYLANKELTVKRAWVGWLLSSLGTLSYYIAYIFILLETIAGVITLGSLTFLAGSFNQMRNLLQGIMTRFSRIAESALYLQDYFDFMAIRPLMQSPDLGAGKKVPRPILDGFVFEDVSFKYANSEKWAARHLSFHLKAGEKLALVGENGAGKTTIVKLLTRLYEPTEGRILLDGVDLKEYDAEDLRDATSVIFQDYIRFQMLASENVAIGKISQLENLPKIQGAAVKSLADTVIDDLPEKYNQMLGKRFGKGVDLSGGQWQKIALARAYMREAQLLILDEPTAALDARAEHEVFLRFAELTKGKTAVLISHRFSTVRMADRILFLENGSMLELGTHEELLQQGGKYAELFNLQAQGYV